MTVDLQIVSEREKLSNLADALKKCRSDEERIEVLDQDPRVREARHEKHELILKSLTAIGQEDKIASDQMLEELVPVESFYKEMGGIVGYHSTMLSFLSDEGQFQGQEDVSFHRPPGIDISTEDDDVKTYVLEGILSLPQLAEIYPVGGAADRLGQPLPAAMLPFCGKSLLEGLIRDVQAKEYLFYKLFGEEIVTPIAMMTSSEKDNHRQILALCEESRWFGRPQESIRFFCQPMVPTMDRQGSWCRSDMRWLMKPGGHGVIWKVAKDQGIFEWLLEEGRQKILVRQINNPVASTDYGILAFCGVGFAEEKQFGFASCPRQIESAEGMNILLQKQSCFCLTNIEYSYFQKFGIEDVPEQMGSLYSRFPSNTNILFADIAAVDDAVKYCPIPGMLVNLKKVTIETKEMEVARLESTMQNIADCFEEARPLHSPIDKLSLKTYLTYNHRRKTISTTKKHHQVGQSLLETPEGCFYDLLQNAYELLSGHCEITLPSVPDAETYIQQGPSFLFHYHPALGPLFSIIGQKIRGGTLSDLSELKLEIAEVHIENLQLEGALHIIADQIMGELDEEGILHSSENVGRCRLNNVKVQNRGFDPHATNIYWKDEIIRMELCKIVIHGDGEFEAEDVVLTGDMCIEVQSGTRVTAYQEEGKLQFKTETISHAGWGWIYHIEDSGSIYLELK